MTRPTYLVIPCPCDRYQWPARSPPGPRSRQPRTNCGAAAGVWTGIRTNIKVNWLLSQGCLLPIVAPEFGPRGVTPTMHAAQDYETLVSPVSIAAIPNPQYSLPAQIIPRIPLISGVED